VAQCANKSHVVAALNGSIPTEFGECLQIIRRTFNLNLEPLVMAIFLCQPFAKVSLAFGYSPHSLICRPKITPCIVMIVLHIGFPFFLVSCDVNIIFILHDINNCILSQS
jgi:hypothetical protein